MSEFLEITFDNLPLELQKKCLSEECSKAKEELVYARNNFIKRCDALKAKEQDCKNLWITAGITLGIAVAAAVVGSFLGPVGQIIGLVIGAIFVAIGLVYTILALLCDRELSKFRENFDKAGTRFDSSVKDVLAKCGVFCQGETTRPRC